MEELTKFYSKSKGPTVSCGDRHTAVLTDRGELYCFGSNDKGQLGLGHNVECNIPMLVPFDYKIIRVSCGGKTTAIITEAGKLYISGQSLSELNNSSNLPKLLEFDREIISVVCSTYHMVFITEDGSAYIYGRGRKYGANEDVVIDTTVPGLIDLPEVVIAVSCGTFHTCVVTESGKLYTFGLGAYDQLGTGDSNKRLLPTLIPFDDGEIVIAVSSGTQHTAVVTEEGFAYTFGFGIQGQLGQGSYGDRKIPTLIGTFRERIIAVSCGDNHTLFGSESGKLYACGNNYSNQLGTLNYIMNKNTPELVPLTNVVCFAGGGSHTAVITDDNKLYMFGSGVHGQLGLGTNKRNNTPKRVALDLI